jgi:hypothetical protein
MHDNQWRSLGWESGVAATGGGGGVGVEGAVK